MKTKIIEIPEYGVKITVEALTLPAIPKYDDATEDATLCWIERSVVEKVLGKDSAVSLTPYCKLQHVADTRQVFCYVAMRNFKYSTREIANYLGRGTHTVAHAVRCVLNANMKDDPSLFLALRRYEQ